MAKQLNLLLSITVFISITAFSQKHLKQVVKTGKSLVIDKHVYTTLTGFIEVPEDYENQKSKQILLPFYVVKCPAQNPGVPIFWLDGGPGGSNLLTEKKISSSSPTELLAKHDFVCVGYRGVDGTPVLSSKKINKAMKGLHHKMLSDESLDNIELKIKEYCVQLKKEGIDISSYTILNVIEDMENVRRFLGYSSIHLLSVSYGTRVALLYGYKHPEIIKRTIMIGCVPPGHFLTNPYQLENTLDLYDQRYKMQNTSMKDVSIKEAMHNALKNMPKRWSLFKLDSDKIKAGTTAALYSKDMAILAFDAYFKASNYGDYSGLFLLQKIQDMNRTKAIGDVFAKTISADISDTVDYTNFRQKLRNTNTTLGHNISLIYGSVAHAWSIKSIPSEFKSYRMSDTETLIISGDLDFKTPTEITQKELMPYLKKGQHLELKNSSHSDVFITVLKNPEFMRLYFDEGIMNSSLIKQSENLDFKPRFTISKAKLFVLGIIK